MTGEEIKEKVVFDLSKKMIHEAKTDTRNVILSKLEQIETILKKGDNVEIRKNPKGEIVILEVSKKNIR